MNTYNPADIARQIIEAIQKEYKELKKLNIMIVGKTGVGKSTLINNMFMEKIVETGIGKPITQNIQCFTKDNFPLAIYDTPGLELDGTNSVDGLLEQIDDIIKRGVVHDDIGEAIHCMWYCISTPSNRIEEAEINFLKNFFSRDYYYNIPVIIVLTQAYSKKRAKELKQEIEKEQIPIVGIVPVLAENYEIDEEYTALAFGLDRLSEIMNNVVADSVKKTFTSIQAVNLKLKKEKARAVVIASATVAAATGAVPIPFSDAAVLVPEQIAMMAGITACFGLQLEKATLTAIVSSTIGTAGTTVAGKTIVSNILKFIPGVGSVAGGAISAATAASLTIALGEAYIIVLSKIYKGEIKVEELNTSKGKEDMKQIFAERMKIKRTGKDDIQVE